MSFAYNLLYPCQEPLGCRVVPLIVANFYPDRGTGASSSELVLVRIISGGLDWGSRDIEVLGVMVDWSILSGSLQLENKLRLK